MALRALMKKRELDILNKQLDELRAKKEEMAKREEEITKMIDEAETDEERSAVEEEVNSFEQEREDCDCQIGELEEKIGGIEKELGELEEAQQAPEETEEERKVEHTMNKRNILNNMDTQRREAFLSDEGVKDFIGEVRTAIKEKRALTNAGLLIPKVMLGMIRENVEAQSKLVKHVNLRQISGTGTEIVMGTIPEGVWTDMCGVLNELSLGFNDEQVAGWKVGGYFSVCNAILEDSDFDLAAELTASISKGIALALDKAILFGTGTRMPQGIFTRLKQTSQPEDYSPTARQWVDLHTSNILTIASNKTGVDFFKELINDSAAAKGKYSNGAQFWAMNDKTYKKVISESISVNAAGAIVAGVDKTMPIIGGAIEVLEFIPDDVIIGGYGDLYLLAERAGVRLGSSEHARFIEDQTVFKGTARYDGKSVIAEGFVAIGVNGTTPSDASIVFPPDLANESE